MLSVGQKAPVFVVSDIFMRTVKLEPGKKKVLAFLRYIGCPYCQRDIMKLISNKKSFENADVILFSHSPADVLRKYIDRIVDFPFKMVSDPQKLVYKMYEVEDGNVLDFVSPSAFIDNLKTLPTLKDYKFVPGGIDSNFYTRPAFFVIDENTVIKYIYRAKNVADSFDINDLLRYL